MTERIQPVCDECKQLYIRTGSISLEHNNCAEVLLVVDRQPDPLIYGEDLE